MNIEPIILRKQIEERRILDAFCVAWRFEMGFTVERGQALCPALGALLRWVDLRE